MHMGFRAAAKTCTSYLQPRGAHHKLHGPFTRSKHRRRHGYALLSLILPRQVAYQSPKGFDTHTSGTNTAPLLLLLLLAILLLLISGEVQGSLRHPEGTVLPYLIVCTTPARWRGSSTHTVSKQQQSQSPKDVTTILVRTIQTQQHHQPGPHCPASPGASGSHWAGTVGTASQCLRVGSSFAH